MSKTNHRANATRRLEEDDLEEYRIASKLMVSHTTPRTPHTNNRCKTTNAVIKMMSSHGEVQIK
jgi:hypothetical protein